MIQFGPVLTLILTVLWIAAITNAINLIDGLDGLVGGVSIISLMTMGVISYFFLYDTDIFLNLTIFVLVAAKRYLKAIKSKIRKSPNNDSPDNNTEHLRKRF